MSESGTRPVRLWISPELMRSGAEQVRWTWRELLTGIGLPWSVGSDPAGDWDVAYCAAGERCPPSRIRIVADRSAWQGPPRSDAVAWLVAHSSSSGWDSVLSRNGDGIVCPRDVIADAFSVLGGGVERGWAENRHGHRSLPGDSDYRDLCMEAPLSMLYRNLGETLSVAERGLDPIPRWPGGATWAAAATHDVDYPEVLRWLEPLRIALRLGRGALSPAWQVFRGSRDHWHFENWIRAERGLGVRSAFYFVARKGSLARYALGTPDPFYDVTSWRFRELFRRIESEGFEVGLHASYRAGEDVHRLAGEKQVLEDALGHPLGGNRHHYWRLEPGNPERTLAMHGDVGLDYDCSLALEHHLGWRRGHSWPFRPYAPDRGTGVDTVQLSTAWMDDQVFSYAAINRIGSDIERDERLRQLIGTAADSGGLLVTDIHEYVFDEELFPGWRSTYQRFWEAVCSDSDVWVASPGEVARHWIARAARIEQRSVGLGV